MARNVIILGAGASASAGAPLMKNFLDIAEKMKDAGIFEKYTEKVELIYESFSELYKFFAKIRFDINNVESFMGALEMAKLLKSLGEYSEEKIDKIYDSLITLIVMTIENSVIFFSSKDENVTAAGNYSGLISEIERHLGFEETAILTFNYDVALDYELYKHGVNINYCLPHVVHGKDQKGKTIKLIKLHGSINWGAFREEQKIKIYPSFIEDHFRNNEGFLEINPDSLSDRCNTANLHFRGVITADIRYWKLSFMDYLSNLNSANGEFIKPAIIPPTWDKTGFRDLMSSVWSFAVREFNDAKNIYFFGYSLPETDSFVKYLIALGCIGATRIERFWVFNTDRENSVLNRYREIVGATIEERFRFFLDPFENVADIFSRRSITEGKGFT